MSPGFEQLKPAIEGADRRIDASQTNVNLAKVEAEFKKVEAAIRLKDPKIREQYEKMLAEQRAKFEALKDGNDQKHIDALRAAVKGTLDTLNNFCSTQGVSLKVNARRQYAEITGVARLDAKWEKGNIRKFSTIDHIIAAYIPGAGSYGSLNYRRAMCLLLNQRKANAPGHTASYDISRAGDAAEWVRAEAETRKVEVGEEFDFWRVRVALGQQISRPPVAPQATVDTGPLPELVPLVPPAPNRKVVPAARAPAGAPAAMPVEASTARAPESTDNLPPSLSLSEKVALNTFAKAIEQAFGALQKAGDAKGIERALNNIKAQADNIALYEKRNPNSNALPQLRAMRMQCEAFLTQATLAMRAAQGEQMAKDAREDTRGFWSGLRVLNAIPKAYRAVSGDRDIMTYSEARSQVMDMRARELSQPAKGAEVVFTALSQQPPISLRELRGMGPKRLIAAGLANAGQEGAVHSAVQDFFMSPEGRRLIAVDENRLTKELDKALAQQALRVEEGAGWEKVGDVTSSLASIDQIALTLATAGGATLGRLAAQSAWAVRGAAVAARGLEAAKAIKGLGVAVRAGEAIVTWSPAEIKALKAAEAAGQTVKVAKALARGTLSLGTSLGRFAAASAAAEAVVPGSGHFVLAACFVVPGAMKGFSEAVGKNVSEVFARSGGNMAAGEMPEMTRAYLLYLRSTQTQAALAKNLQASLQKESGMAATDAEKAASAFTRDLFEGQTGRELETLAAQKKPGVISSVREYVGARRSAKVAQDRVGGMPRYGERYRAGAQREAQEAGAKVREALGPIGKIDKLPGIVLENLKADVRKTADDFVSAYNRVVDVLGRGKKLTGDIAIAVSARAGAMVRNLNALVRNGGDAARAVWEKASAQYQALVKAVQNDRAAQNLLNQAQTREGGLLRWGEIGAKKAEAGAVEARAALVETLGLKKIVELPGVVRQKLSLDARQTVDDFVGAYNRVTDLLGRGRDFAGEKGVQVLEGFRGMIQNLNRLASSGSARAKEAWNAAMARYRAVVDAIGNDRAAQGLLKQAETREGGLLKWGQVGLRKAEAGAAESRGVLVEKLGLQRIVKIPDAIRNTLSADLKKTVEDFVGVHNKLAGMIKGGLNISKDKVGEFVTARRGELVGLWQQISKLPAVARGWAQKQWIRLSDGLEKFAESWKAKGAKTVDASEEYLAARRLLRKAKEGGGSVGVASQMRGVEATGRELQEALGVHRIVALPGKIRAALSADLRKTVDDFAGAYNRVGEVLRDGLNVSKEKVGAWITARRGELTELWSRISGLPETARGWAQRQWTKLSNGLESFAKSWQAKEVKIADATGEYVAARKAVRAADKMKDGVLPGGTVRLEAEKRAFERARVEFADAIGLTKLQALKEGALLGLKEGIRKAARALVADANAFVEKYADVAQAARVKSAAFVAEAKALQARIGQLIDKLPSGSPLRPLLASTGERLGEMAK